MVRNIGFFILCLVLVARSYCEIGDVMTSDTPHRLSSQEQGQRFDLLATNAKEYALFLIGLDGHLICWNAGAERLFGYHSHEIMGQHFSKFFSPEDTITGQPAHELKTA